MIDRLKAWAKRHWPPLRLRTILFATLILVAALPGFGAIFLRVYENTLVRQTESELIAQGSALAAAASAVWPQAQPSNVPANEFRPEPPGIDLRSTPVLAERPAPQRATAPNVTAIEASRSLGSVFAQTKRTTLASIVLLDGAGRVVAGARGGSLAQLPEVRQALSGRPATVLRENGAYRATYMLEWLSRAAAIRIHHARPIVVNGQVAGVLLLSRSPRALFRGIYEDRGKIALGVVTIFGLLILLTGLLSRGIARPIELLGKATKAVATGRGEVPEPPVTAAIEIQDLYRDFAAMAEAIERRSRYLRDFAHAVSHEFKTPLSGIRGAIELLQDHADTMSPAERRRFLANADGDAGRLSLLVSRLLELAKADMDSVAPGTATPVGPVIAAVADALKTDRFALRTKGAGNLPRVSVPAATLERVLTTLAENSRQSGATLLQINARQKGDALVLDLSDDGSGIAAADRGRIFEPFFTTKRSQAGSGLGLAIARSLLHAAGATIALQPSDSGTRFELHLPVTTA